MTPSQKFESIVGNIPTSEIELTWTDGHGLFRDETHEIYTTQFSITCDVFVREKGVFHSATRNNPSEYSEKSQQIEVDDPVLYIEDEEFELSEDEETQLIQSIKNSIKIQ